MAFSLVSVVTSSLLLRSYKEPSILGDGIMDAGGIVSLLSGRVGVLRSYQGDNMVWYHTGRVWRVWCDVGRRLGWRSLEDLKVFTMRMLFLRGNVSIIVV